VPLRVAAGVLVREPEPDADPGDDAEPEGDPDLDNAGPVGELVAVGGALASERDGDPELDGVPVGPERLGVGEVSSNPLGSVLHPPSTIAAPASASQGSRGRRRAGEGTVTA
jgi:hypothetical protein